MIYISTYGGCSNHADKSGMIVGTSGPSDLQKRPAVSEIESSFSQVPTWPGLVQEKPFSESGARHPGSSGIRVSAFDGVSDRTRVLTVRLLRQE